MASQEEVRARLLAVLVVVVVAGALKLTQPVTLPLAAAVFVIVLAWPLHTRLEAALPRGLAYGVTLLAVLVLLGAFIGATVWSLGVVMERAPEFIARLEELRDRLGGWAEERALPVGGGGEEGRVEAGADTVFPLVASVWRAGATLFLTIAFFVLALGEVRRYRTRLIGHFGKRGERALQGIGDVGRKVRGFVVALTLAGLLGGVLSLGYGLALGLEHVFVWAFLAYLLNYIPVVGSTIAVFPPTLWALVQFDGVGRPLAVLLGFGAIQFIVGNYVAPKFEGRYTHISPLAVLVSIVLWGWIWGPIGAVLGVPITVGLVSACAYTDRTRWIAALLSEEPR